jgi:hypothetical protein
VTGDEIKLLDGLARKLEDLTERVAGMEIVLSEVAKSHGQPELTTARLRIRCDLLRMKGTPSAYLDAFLGSLE